jgi:hypothetical protein
MRLARHGYFPVFERDYGGVAWVVFFIRSFRQSKDD